MFRTMLRTARVAVVTLTLYTAPTHAAWTQLLSEDFNAASLSGWMYSGVQNGSGQDLIRHVAGSGHLAAEWDQSNFLSAGSDPATVTSSYFSRPLPQALTDAQSFRFGATLRVDAGSIPDTTEFYQLANFGLGNRALSGPDRTLSSSTVPDASNLVEFNYFINNDSFGFNPNIQPTIITHHDGHSGFSHLITGTAGDPLFHDTDMGEGNYLPSNTDLFIEVAYYGGHAGPSNRRVYGAVYTDASKATLLEVNGVPMFYWTQAVPSDQHFTLTDAVFANYPGVNWGGTNGAGSGTFDDLYVDLVPEPGTLVLGLAGLVCALAFRRRRG